LILALGGLDLLGGKTRAGIGQLDLLQVLFFSYQPDGVAFYDAPIGHGNVDCVALFLFVLEANDHTVVIFSDAAFKNCLFAQVLSYS